MPVERHRDAPLRTPLLAEGEGSRALAFAQRVAFIGDGEGRVSRLDIDSGELLSRTRAHDGPIDHLVVSDDGRTLATAAAGTVVLWDAPTPQPRQSFALTAASLALSPDARHLAVAHGEGGVALIDTVSGTQVQDFRLSSHAIKTVRFAPNGHLFATSANGELFRVELSSGAVVQQASGPPLLYAPLAITPDGRRTVTALDSRTLAVRDASTGVLERTIDSVTGRPSGFAFSPDGHMLAVGTVESRLNLLDGETFARSQWLRRSGSHTLVFAHDGEHLLSNGYGQPVLFRFGDAAARAEAHTPVIARELLEAYHLDPALEPILSDALRLGLRQHTIAQSETTAMLGQWGSALEAKLVSQGLDPARARDLTTAARMELVYAWVGNEFGRTYRDARAQAIEALTTSVPSLAPFLTDLYDQLDDRARMKRTFAAIFAEARAVDGDLSAPYVTPRALAMALLKRAESNGDYRFPDRARGVRSDPKLRPTKIRVSAGGLGEDDFRKLLKRGHAIIDQGLEGADHGPWPHFAEWAIDGEILREVRARHPRGPRTMRAFYQLMSNAIEVWRTTADSSLSPNLANFDTVTTFLSSMLPPGENTKTHAKRLVVQAANAARRAEHMR